MVSEDIFIFSANYHQRTEKKAYSSSLIGSTVTITPLSVISAFHNSLSPDSTFKSWTNPLGIVISIEPLFSLILVLKDILCIYLPFVFHVIKYTIFTYIFLSVSTTIKTKGLYTTSILHIQREIQRVFPLEGKTIFETLPSIPSKEGIKKGIEVKRV